MVLEGTERVCGSEECGSHPTRSYLRSFWDEDNNAGATYVPCRRFELRLQVYPDKEAANIRQPIAFGLFSFLQGVVAWEVSHIINTKSNETHTVPAHAKG